jgi:hypothetical protein
MPRKAYQVYQDFRLVVGVLGLADVTSLGWVVAQSAEAASRLVGYLPTRFPSAVYASMAPSRQSRWPICCEP